MVKIFSSEEDVDVDDCDEFWRATYDGDESGDDVDAIASVKLDVSCYLPVALRRKLQR